MGCLPNVCSRVWWCSGICSIVPGSGTARRRWVLKWSCPSWIRKGVRIPLTGPCWPGILILRFNWNWIASISSTILPRFPWPELPSVECRRSFGHGFNEAVRGPGGNAGCWITWKNARPASAGGRRLAGPVSGKIGPGLSRWRMDGAQLSQATAGEWVDPKTRDVGTTVEEFLTRLGGPTWIVLSGRDPLRTRAVTTLLHGNEPSGVRAIFQWLRSGTRPRVNLACFIGAVEAALAQPGFAYRHLPECP